MLFSVHSLSAPLKIYVTSCHANGSGNQGRWRVQSGISRGTQTDPITIKATALVRPILRGLVSILALQVLATYDHFVLFLADSPGLRALLTFCLIRCIRPVLRGVHFTLIWIGVVLRILSAVIAIITPDPI